MKILLRCVCNRRLTLEKSNGLFAGTCRECHREHKVKIEIKDHSILKKAARWKKSIPDADLDKWFQESEFTPNHPRAFIPATYPVLS